jgi:hypothetical protein
MFRLIRSILDAVVHQMLLGQGPRILRRKIDRHRFYTTIDHGRFPAGSACWISRARADAFVVLEMDDGSVVELGPGGYVAGLEVVDDLNTLHELLAFMEALDAPRTIE